MKRKLKKNKSVLSRMHFRIHRYVAAPCSVFRGPTKPSSLVYAFSPTKPACYVWRLDSGLCTLYTDKKEKKIFLLYKEIQKGSVAKSYMKKGFLTYEELGKYLVIYDEAVSHI
jgi:hypothetical protein